MRGIKTGSRGGESAGRVPPAGHARRAGDPAAGFLTSAPATNTVQDTGIGLKWASSGRGIVPAAGPRAGSDGDLGGVTGLVNAVAVILVNGKVDRPTGRVDVLQEAVTKRP